ncbi:hypothetical protein NL108_014313 [Boleophthalmus pectinirostris]|nr:hypothetical protein NL108_014313 [Boleophthalmus pectinirostris]
MDNVDDMLHFKFTTLNEVSNKVIIIFSISQFVSCVCHSAPDALFFLAVTVAWLMFGGYNMTVQLRVTLRHTVNQRAYVTWELYSTQVCNRGTEELLLQQALTAPL